MECVENNISALRKLGFIVDFENQNSSVSSVASVLISNFIRHF